MFRTVFDSIRHRVMTTCGIAGPAWLLALGFGVGFTLCAAWTSTASGTAGLGWALAAGFSIGYAVGARTGP